MPITGRFTCLLNTKSIAAAEVTPYHAATNQARLAVAALTLVSTTSRMQSANDTAGTAGMRSQTSTRPLLLPTRATRHLVFSTSVNMTLTVIIETPTPNAPTALKSESPDASFTPHEDFDISIIWHNLDSRSDFLTFRKES